MRKPISTLLLMLGLAGTTAVAQSDFKDIRIDLTNAAFLEETEKDGSALSFGVAIADDGTQTRVAADDASANIVLTGKFHSNEHGWGNFSATVAVTGPVEIGMGSCAWGGDVTVKNAAGETVATFNTNNGACFHNDKTANIVTTKYAGEATTLTISGGSYTPYISVVALGEGELPTYMNITYSFDNTVAIGTAPAAESIEVGKTWTVPLNRTLYAEGKTLTGWSDGTTVYAPGQTVDAVAGDVTLTAVFTDNAVAFADRTEPATVTWDFQRKNGAPTIAYQGVTAIYVAQAEVGGASIDMKLDIDATSGKVANGNWNDWAQMNGGTRLTIPSCKGMEVSLEAYNALGTGDAPTTIDGQSDYTSGKVISYTIANTAETIDIVIGSEGSYYRYVKATYPVVEKDYAGTTFENAEASVIWAFNNASTYDTDYTSAPDGAFSLVSVDLGTLSTAGTATGRAVDEDGNTVTFIKLQPTSAKTEVATWSVKPARGLTFTPTKVTGYIQRFGTNVVSGVTVSASLMDGTVTNEQLGTYTAPRAPTASTPDDQHAGESNYTNQFVIELSAEQQAMFTSAEGFSLSATVGVGSGKQGGFSDIRIYGTVNGTIEAVAKYAVATAVSPEGAGVASIYPAADTYEEGTEITVSVEENFGYDFVNWTNAAGEEVSTTPKFTYTVTADETLTANFKEVATYALDLTVEAPANDYMVTWSPAPTVVDGKTMYEAGTKVTLTAAGNRILTFAGWSNGETSGEIAVTMDADVTLTAAYSAVDFIAGWDFYLAGGNGRIADFAAEDNDADQFVLRDADGNTSGWLDKSQQAAGGYEGKPAAVNWRNNAEIGTYYWQTKVNAEAFTDIIVYAEMLYNYNAYQKQDVEYSIDGESWTKVGTIYIEGAKKWTPGEFALPSDANNQPALYIRWIADKTSKLDGSTSANDGTSITNVFVTGEARPVDDGTAPLLVSSTPAEGSTTASANGKIVLTFDEKVKVATGATATLGDMTLTPTVSGKSVLFEYKGLNYSTEYTFTLPGGSIADRNDNAIADPIVIHFSTKTKPVVEKGLYDFVVPDDGTFKEAIAAANDRADKTVRFYIFVKRGYYELPWSETETITSTTTGTSVTLPSPITYLNAANTSIIGEDRDETTVKNLMKDITPSGTTYPIEGLHNVTTLYINKGADNTYIQDITLKNGMNDATGRGEAIEDCANKTICKNVTLWGYQDTYCSNNGSGRAYFEGGLLRGRTDFLCGKGDIYYNGVTLQMCEKGGYIAVPSQPKQYGYIFKDCEIVGEEDGIDGNFTLGRPWGSGTPIALYIDTKMTVQPSAIGWNEMSGGWPARFAEYNSTTATGTVIDLSARKTIFADTHENNPVLTQEEAEFYTIANVLGGDDDWDPTEATEQASAPTGVIISGSNLTWDDNSYIRCWAIVMNGNVIAFTTEPTFVVDDPTATYAVRAANEMGGLSEATEAVAAGETAIETLRADRAADGVTHDLMGRRIARPVRGGIYIQDGRKFVAE